MSEKNERWWGGMLLALLVALLALAGSWGGGVVSAQGEPTRTPRPTNTMWPTVTRPARETPPATRTPRLTTTRIPRVTATPSPTATPEGEVAPPSGPLPDGWLERLNYYRALAGLQPVTEEQAWRASTEAHARYMVKTDTVSHSQSEGSPHFDASGLEAAQAGNVMVSGQEETPDREAIDYWMAAAFHGIALVDPQLERSAFGSYREGDGGWEMAATLDVERGLGEAPEAQRYPIVWPRGEAPIPLAFPGSEWPDPLGGCPGYATPVGAPLYIQMGEGDALFVVGEHSLKRDGEEIEHCLFDETTFTHPDVSQQAVGRTILSLRDAIVILPRDPLVIGAEYEVRVVVNGEPIEWSFTPRAADEPTEPQRPRLPYIPFPIGPR